MTGGGTGAYCLIACAYALHALEFPILLAVDRRDIHRGSTSSTLSHNSCDLAKCELLRSYFLAFARRDDELVRAKQVRLGLFIIVCVLHK